MRRRLFYRSWLVLCLGLVGCTTNREEDIKKPLPARYSVRAPEFRQAMGSLLGPQFVEGNAVTTLLNGREIFPAMLSAIRDAKETINFETYVYWEGEIGREFGKALAESAERGVRVKVLRDAQGSSKIGRETLARMTAAGVEVEEYHRFHWWNLKRYNNRTHRKLLIVDGRIGFTGGVGIADEWMGNADSPEHWRDTHFRLKGPVVAQLQAIFAENWLKARQELIYEADYFPPLRSEGDTRAQAFGSSPGQGDLKMQMMYLLAISSARHNLRIANAYFVPDKAMQEALIEASERGVRVEIIVPNEQNDSAIVHFASRMQWPKLLKAGIRIFEYQPTMFHAKLMIVDDYFVTFGSANFDNRSIRLNDEANVNVLDTRFAAEQIRTFQRDRRQCQEATLDGRKGISFIGPLEVAASLAAPQL